VLQNVRRGGERNRRRTDGDGRVKMAGTCCHEYLPAHLVPVTDQRSSKDSQCCSPTRHDGDDILDVVPGDISADRSNCCNREGMNDIGTHQALAHGEGPVETQTGTDSEHGDRYHRQDNSTSDRPDSGR
jgi:hypothetical protein